jgi:hypothetical protein
MKIDTNIIILSIILLIIVVISAIIGSIKSKNTYLLYLKSSLPVVAENIIQDILDDNPDSTSIDDILNFKNQFMIDTELYTTTLELVKHKMISYIKEYIDRNVSNTFVKNMLNKINSDSDIIIDAVELALTSNENELYDKLIKLLYDHAFNRLNEIEKEDKKAEKIAEDYENETVEDVVEYNGELDKSEFDVARENFEPTGADYPEEEDLNEIPEELVEIIAMSEEDEK